MRGWGDTVGEITRLLTEVGPMTRAEMCQQLGLDRMSLSAVVTRMNRPGKTYPKRLYVMGYVHDHDGKKRYPRAVYALGELPDAKRPRSDARANKKRYREGLKLRMTANSVFHLGLTRRQYEAIRRSAVRVDGLHGV